MAPPLAFTVLHLMRLTLEATSPISIGSGDSILRQEPKRGKNANAKGSQEYRSAAIVRDANGLPVIPGASSQGVLRALYAAEWPGEETALFGWAKRDLGEAARLVVGFGCAHDSADVAMVGLHPLALLQRDAILKVLIQDAPFERDHVALNSRHVVADRQKFARAAVPPGSRFSLELSLWGTAEAAATDREALGCIAGLFSHPLFRLGGAGGRGYGRVKVVRASYQAADLTRSDALRAIREQPPSTPLASKVDVDAPLASATIATLKLRPVGPWRIGGRGAPSMTEETHGVRLAPDGVAPPLRDMDRRDRPEPGVERDLQLIARECSIHWSGGKGELCVPSAKGPWEFSAPGSAIKGPLVHRTVFHLNQFRAQVIDVDAFLAMSPEQRSERVAQWTRPAELEPLLGVAKEGVDSGDGRAARVLVADGEVSGVRAVQAIDHNSIDRFTGGVRNGALYAEEVLVGGEISVEVTIRPPLERDAVQDGVAGWSQGPAEALLSALHDLCKGRLAIGAKSLGFCEGRLVWRGAGAAAWHERASTLGGDWSSLEYAS
jgi:CRISPR/Cas system CSM-associated protein Csm3 (group 7 of RAMP superfamily)